VGVACTAMAAGKMGLPTVQHLGPHQVLGHVGTHHTRVEVASMAGLEEGTGSRRMEGRLGSSAQDSGGDVGAAASVLGMC
jgi:hypothetical protein